LVAQDWQDLKDSNYGRFSAAEQAALQFADKLTRDLRSISDADVQALKQHFSDEQVLDLDVLVGLVNLTNRLTDPLGADLEFPAEKI
jgi:alkylhydroperoxidase family enzyme